MRKIVILNEMNKATREALDAVKHGVATEAQKILAAKHNAGVKAGKELAIANRLSNEIDASERDSKGKTAEEQTRTALINNAKNYDKDVHIDIAADRIRDGMRLKNNKPVDVTYLDNDKVPDTHTDLNSTVDEIKSLNDKDMRRITRKLGRRNAPIKLRHARYNGEYVSVPSRDSLRMNKDGDFPTIRKGIQVDSGLTPEKREEAWGTIASAQEKSRRIRSLQQFGKKK